MPGAQALGDQKITLVVDPGQQPSVRRHLGLLTFLLLGHIGTFGQQPQDPVEGSGQRVGRGADLRADLFVVAFDPQVAFAGPHHGLAVGQPVRRMASHGLAKHQQLGIGVIGLLGVTASFAVRRNDKSLSRRPQCRGQIATHPGLTVLNPLRQCHGAQRCRGTGVVSRGNSSCPTVLGQNHRTRIIGVVGRLENHRQPSATAGHVDDVAAPQRGQGITGHLPALQS